MTAPPRLSIATNNGDVGGGEMMLVQLAEAASSLDVDVVVVGPAQPSGVLDLARDAGLATVALPATDRRGYMRALRRWDRRERHGLLWCNGLVPATATAGHPDRVVHLHQPPSGLQKVARRVAVRGTRAVVVPSAYLGTFVPHTRVLPNWTADHGRVPPRVPLGVPDGEPVLGFLGRLTLEKGVDVLAEAVTRLVDDGRPVRLLLAGASRFASSRDERVVAAALDALGDRVSRIGWVDSPRELFDRIDLAIFPSDWPEPFGLVAAEAMSAGVPFVISDAGGLVEVAGADYPWVARAGDADELARTIAAALDAPVATRDAIVDAAHGRWESEFSGAAGRNHLAATLRSLGLPIPATTKDNARERLLVVPSRGGAHRLPVLLDSVAAQDDADVEVVVVVDGDVDGSEQVLAERPEPWVRSIVFPENRGRAAALNAGFAAADGDILVRCDDDLELEPDFVAHHRRLHAEAEHGVITLCSEVFEQETSYSRVFGGPADERIHAAAMATVPDQRWRWWSGCVSATRAVHDRVGPYDVAFRRYGWEDIDWGYRLHRAGVPIVIPNGFRTRHHGPVTSVRERAQRAFHSGASRLTFESIHGDDALAAPLSGTDVPRTPWTRLVDATSALATERSVVTVGSALDRVISPRAPRLSEKLVSLLVEASSEAGRRHPERIRSTF